MSTKEKTYPVTVAGATEFIKDECMLPLVDKVAYIIPDPEIEGVFGIVAKESNKVIGIIYSPSTDRFGWVFGWDFELNEDEIQTMK